MFSQSLDKKKALTYANEPVNERSVKMRACPSSRTFTLVELLVVIAIVGLLSTIVLAVTSGVSEQGRIAKDLQFSQHLQNTLGADAVGIWSMDENPATQGAVIKDMSGWGNNGTLNTGETGVNKSVAGVMGQAISFDGVDDYINCGNDNSLNISGSITVGIWINPTLESGGDYPRAIIKERFVSGSDRGGFMVTVKDSGLVDFAILNNGYSQASTNVAKNEWTYLVGIHDVNRNLLEIYKNGELKHSIVPTVTIGDHASASLKIGGTQYFKGSIDEVHIYNTALTSSQIKSQYYTGLDRLLTKGLIDEQEYRERLTLK
jgi:prepilin-type N-terminal cleavage/methylation domain-containing protein